MRQRRSLKGKKSLVKKKKTQMQTDEKKKKNTLKKINKQINRRQHTRTHTHNTHRLNSSNNISRFVANVWEEGPLENMTKLNESTDCVLGPCRRRALLLGRFELSGHVLVPVCKLYVRTQYVMYKKKAWVQDVGYVCGCECVVYVLCACVCVLCACACVHNYQ